MFKLTGLRYFLLFSFFILTYQTGICQYKIEGIAKDSLTNSPASFATVYLANTSYAANSDEYGFYSITNVPSGTYELVFSLIGYERHSLLIRVGETKQLSVHVKLIPKAEMLNEIVVSSKTNEEWQKNLGQFERDFLGHTPNARKCAIINPQVLQFDTKENGQRISGSSQGFLIVNNLALGYKIKYELINYQLDKQKGISSYYGHALFEEMAPKNEGEKKKWKRNRSKAYNGSFQHFIKALLSDQLHNESFIISKKSAFEETGYLSRDSVLKRTQHPGLKALIYRDVLYVGYNKEYEDNYYKMRFGSLSGNYSRRQTSMLYFYEPVIIERNGFIRNPVSFIRYGYWAYENTAEMLPLNYEPEKKTTK